MFLVIYTGRAKSPDDARMVCEIFNHDLTLVQTPGYLGGQCALKVDEPCVVVGVHRWGSRDALQYQLDSESHRRVIADIAPHLDSPAEITVYEVLG